MNDLKVYKERPCKKCGVVFATQRCSPCKRAAYRKWREGNPEKVKERTRKQREENPEKVKATIRKWREKNPEKVKAAARKWREENPENAKATARKHIEILSDCYVSKRIGALIKDLSPEIIELKREQLSMFRLNKELNATIQQLTKEVK